MPLSVTGTIGIDEIHTPYDSRTAVLGGSCSYFAAAASFFTKVRMVAAAGNDFHDDYRKVFHRFPNVDVKGLEIRDSTTTFAWGGKYFDDWNTRETLYTNLGVLEEHPPAVPEDYADSKFIFLANSHPAVQRDFLHAFPQRIFSVADSMNLWIETEQTTLRELLREVDGLVINDEEAHMLTGIRNPFAAAKKIRETMGPMLVIIKKGEHGCILSHDQGQAALPAYPTESVVDPTGAGDTFAGGFMGYLAAAHSHDMNVSFDSMHKALAHGTVVASYAIEDFGLERLATITKQDIAHRYEQLVQLTNMR